MIIHASVWFPLEERNQIINLMVAQSSCARSAYQAIHKHGLKSRKDIYVHLKKNYENKLKSIQIYDAIDRVSGINRNNVIFGGKNNLKKLNGGRISKNEWKTLRNYNYYASGDKRCKGNRSVRINGNIISISSPTEFRSYINGKIFIPKKWNDIKLDCYNVRLQYRKEKFIAKISIELPNQLPFVLNSGFIGIDSNPDGLGISDINNDGNLVSHTYLKSERMKFASNNKRTNDIRLLAKRIINLAVQHNKKLVIEKLDFKNKKSYNRKFNRMRHNFIYRKIVESIKSRAVRFGVPVIEVNPAFTSILGILKYRSMYSLNRHTAAALVIARRGAGFQERKTFRVSPVEQTSIKKTDKSKNCNGERMNLEGRLHSHTLSLKAWSWLQDCFLKPNSATLTGSSLAPGQKPGIRPSMGEIPIGESQRITGNLGDNDV